MDSDARVEVSAPLNLCRCGGKDASICTCGHERAAPPALAKSVDGLATLAQAALFCCGADLPQASDKQKQPPLAAVPPLDNASRKHTRSCCSSTANSRPSSPKPKRPKPTSSQPSSHDHPIPAALPPVSMPGQHTLYQSAPLFPPVSTLGSTSFEEARCCCGTQCACPGCVVHRGVEHVAKDHQDCTDGECRTCVDNEGGYALPENVLAYSQGGFASSSSVSNAPLTQLSASSSSASASTAQPGRDRRQSVSCIDAFFATAASLPAPPPGRTGTLDPTNVLVYPRVVLSGDAETRSLFGLIELPKLQCNCPGGCGCPEGQCGCGDGCTGCAPGHEEEEEEEEDRAEEQERDDAPASVSADAPVRSCCCG